MSTCLKVHMYYQVRRKIKKIKKGGGISNMQKIIQGKSLSMSKKSELQIAPLNPTIPPSLHIYNGCNHKIHITICSLQTHFQEVLVILCVRSYCTEFLHLIFMLIFCTINQLRNSKNGQIHWTYFLWKQLTFLSNWSKLFSREKIQKTHICSNNQICEHIL